MSGGSYIGADEVQALIGRWHQIVGGDWKQIVGADVQYGRRPPGWRPPYAPPQYGQPGYVAPPQYPTAPYGAPAYVAPYQTTPVAPVAPGYAYQAQYRPGVQYPHHHHHHHRHHHHPRWRGPDGRVYRIGAEGDVQPDQDQSPPPVVPQAGIPPRNALIEAPGPQRAGREVLPMSTGTEIFPFQSAQITARPQRVAFRPERVFISGSGTENGAADWIVNDIKIGNRSQFSQSGDVPGDMFANNSIDSFISFETAQTAMDVVMVVTYVGPNEGGANFYGAIIGTAAV